MMRKLTFIGLFLSGMLNALAAPIALWGVPYGRDVQEIAHLGVIAYEHSGVTQVVFTVNGANPVTATRETMNPETGEMEFVLKLDTSGYADGALAIGATVWGGGSSTVLPVRNVWVANSTSRQIYYVATNGNDLASGSSDDPFATISNAVAKAAAGDEIRVRDGEYVLNLSLNRGFTRYVLIRADDGASPRIIPPSVALRPGFIHFKGLEFDWTGVASNLPDGGIDGNIIFGWGQPHVWIEDCVFHGPPERYNSYLIAVKLYGGATNLTVEGCEFYDVNVALPLPNGAIARQNYMHDITSDAFDFNSDTLITGNRVHGIKAPKLFIETTNAGPFNVSGLGISFVYSELNNTNSYVNFDFPNLGTLVPNAAAASAADLAAGLMAAANFSAKLSAVETNGHLRVTALRSNYKQRLYVTNTAVSVLGFTQDSYANQAEGSGQHADVFQTWGVSPNYTQSNVVIRNNRAYEVDSQGLLPQVDLSNLVMVNNLLNMFGDSWVIYFEKSYNYRNILIANNTLWGRGNSLILDMTNDPVDFTVVNNIFGPRGASADKVRPGLTMDYNLYDYYVPASGATNALHSLWTNPGKLNPTMTPLFLNVTSFYDSAVSSYTSYAAPDGDFSLCTNSPARDAGSPVFGIKYDVNWNPRGAAPDMGAYEYTVPDADTDGDGMSDQWELWNGFDLNNPADGGQDADSDGASNANEFVYGTDPFDASSYYYMQMTVANGAQLLMSTVSTRFYSVEWNDNLMSTNWQTLSNWIGSGGEFSVSDTNPAASRFYRVRVEPL